MRLRFYGKLRISIEYGTESEMYTERYVDNFMHSLGLKAAFDAFAG